MQILKLGAEMSDFHKNFAKDLFKSFKDTGIVDMNNRIYLLPKQDVVTISNTIAPKYGMDVSLYSAETPQNKLKLFLEAISDFTKEKFSGKLVKNDYEYINYGSGVFGAYEKDSHKLIVNTLDETKGNYLPSIMEFREALMAPNNNATVEVGAIEFLKKILIGMTKEMLENNSKLR